jgi:hypothetical protein
MKETTNSRLNTDVRLDDVCRELANTKIDGSESLYSSSDSDSSSISSSELDSSPPKPIVTQVEKPTARVYATPSSLMEKEAARVYATHMKLLSPSEGQKELNEVVTTPIFTMPVLDHIKSHLVQGAELPIPQYGLLAGVTDGFPQGKNGVKQGSDPRVFFNITNPSSTFICGSQGSGKSHTLSCLLENTLFGSDANKLPHPLTGLVFHYDTFISDDGGSPCEAAFLSSNKAIKVRVLCAPTNVATIRVSSKIFHIHMY